VEAIYSNALYGNKLYVSSFNFDLTDPIIEKPIDGFIENCWVSNNLYYENYNDVKNTNGKIMAACTVSHN